MSFFSSEDGYFALTKTGYIGIVVIMLLLIAVAAVLVGRRQAAGSFSPRKLAYAGIALALAFVTSYLRFELPMGGSVTLFSMFFICLIGYAYGVSAGFVTAFSYSLLQFIQSGGSYMLSPFQICCDYFFAFTALGIAGFWYGKKHGLAIGYTVACLVRGLFHTIGGYIYWMDYMPDWFPKSLAAVYSPIYNYSYILTEMIATLILIHVPPVKAALTRIIAQARTESSLSFPAKEQTASKRLGHLS